MTINTKDVELEKLALDPKYMLPHRTLKAQPEDYRFRAIKSDDSTTFPRKIHYKIEETESGIVLVSRDVDSAVLGYSDDGTILDVLQIQGGRAKYRHLAPVQWDKALIDALIRSTKKRDAIQIVPGHMIDDTLIDHTLSHKSSFDRLRKRYDENALYFGFRFSKEQDRYVLELN